MFDVIIIGGSSAGLSAAIQLGRSRQDVLVIDDGKPCNRFSHASHGFLTRDGVKPAELLAIGRQQLEAYPSVQFHSARVDQIEPLTRGFAVYSSDGQVHEARQVLLAVGIKDMLPPIENMDAWWGRRAFVCPYCDGWEIRDKAVVVYADDVTSPHQILLVRNLTADLTVSTSEPSMLDAKTREQFARHGIRVIDSPIVRLVGDEERGELNEVVLADGETVPCHALFLRPGRQLNTGFAERLNLAHSETGLLAVDPQGRTSVPGIWAAGDCAQPMRSVSVAAASGSAAGAAINYTLVNEDFA